MIENEEEIQPEYEPIFVSTKVIRSHGVRPGAPELRLSLGIH